MADSDESLNEGIGASADDLSEILLHIAQTTYPKTRREIANSRETRRFLDLGLELLRSDLLEHDGPDMHEGELTRIFQSVSRQRLLDRAKMSEESKDHGLSESQFRRRWTHENQYTEDLIAYLFRPGPYRRHLDDMASAARIQARQVSFGALIDSLAEAETSAVLEDNRVTLITFFQAALPNHPRVREFIEKYWYFQVLQSWAAIYEEVCEIYGISLRDGITWYDMSLLFNSVIDGATLRARVGGSVPILSSGRPVLAAAIFAMAPSLLDLGGKDPFDIVAEP